VPWLASGFVFDAPLLFPATPTGPDGGERTTLLLLPDGDRLPLVGRVGTGPAGVPVDGAADDLAALARRGPERGLLVEHARGTYRRPHLRGHRLGGQTGGESGAAVAGRDWSTLFRLVDLDAADDRLVVSARDDLAALGLRTEVEALPGGGLRVRHALTNLGDTPYLVDGLDVGLPLPDTAVELLDFTGRHERERSPQRQPVNDGLWLREMRRGRTGLEAPTMLVAGTAGFGFGHGSVVAVHVGWSGNSAMWVERDPSGDATIGGGELLLPGEVVLGAGESYPTPWVYIVASEEGLDGVAAALHTWQRSLPSHPGEQPVMLNVWEAVYFDHDLDKLLGLAERAARVGVERFVLDDGWFRGRRDNTAGLGDWTVDPDVWPAGLHPLVDRVRALGMQFGLWIEPEMINPDSDLFRRHPEWVLHAGDRTPPTERNQLVLDLTQEPAFEHLLERLDAVLGEYDVDFVKWDHNRDLLEAGSADGVPAARRQALAHYRLLDELRDRHPRVAWESCASGGGRIDLGVLERVQRVWTSDMTDALSRQAIQRWTTQLVAPEYLGAHVSAAESHQTGRRLPLDFRAATAVFGSFGFELDLTAVDEDTVDALADWVRRYRQWRPLLQSGRVVRVESGDPAVWLHGVVATDRRSALFAHVQLDESASNRGVRLRMPGLLDDVPYRVAWEEPVDRSRLSRAPELPADGPTAGHPVSGAALGGDGVWLPRRRPETVTLVSATAVSSGG
jgi:alpha-galactosidase